MSRTNTSGRRPSIFVFMERALRAVLRHKGRSALTALEITIGVAAVVWVVALGSAAVERAAEQLRALEGESWEVTRSASGSTGTIVDCAQDRSACAVTS